MNFVYETLEIYAPVFYEDIERSEDGSVNINQTNIVYSLDGIFDLTEDIVRLDIPLTIDIWYKKEDIYNTLSIIEELERRLDNYTHRHEGKLFSFSKSSNFVLNIPDERVSSKIRTNSNIGRKRLSFMVRYYRVL